MKRSVQIRKIIKDHITEIELDFVATEEPLEIRIRGAAIATVMRTPGDDINLTTGFLYTEGIIEKSNDILEIAHCDNDQSSDGENIINVFLRPGVEIDPDRFTRHLPANSSCGICGKTTIESIQSVFPPITSNVPIKAQDIRSFPEKLRTSQSTFRTTGGLHAAALYSSTGIMMGIYEDVGRHNSVDKIAGHFLKSQTDLSHSILMVSGRVSYEIVQKALALRIPVICAISAPTSLAVEFAADNNQTLIGFIRNERMNVYTGSEHIS
ncbi:MAG: formate dehydrogenase accessory sulfurtransferase FdhD [Verrucomicrobiota bacterium]|nr:formate dehydrogenase accessory sulfurtransferase FdhD [Verrucomicrobiota bacterium]